MASADARLAWYAAALDELPAYLLSDELLWPLQRPPAQVRQDLSLGGLLLVQDSLRVETAPSPAARRKLADLEQRWSSLRDKHASAVARKGRQERGMRVKLWTAYLTELRDKPDLAEEYPHQVRQRAMIERLGELTPVVTDPKLDQALQENFRNGAFVWEGTLKAAYPRERYWFLYGRPEGED